MWSADKEKFHLTKREKRENRFVCGFKSEELSIVIVRFGEKEKLSYYDHNYKATISWMFGTSQHAFKATCFGNNFVDLIKALSKKIDTIFGSRTISAYCKYKSLDGSLFKRPDNIDDDLLSVFINKDIIAAFNKQEEVNNG